MQLACRPQASRAAPQTYMMAQSAPFLAKKQGKPPHRVAIEARVACDMDIGAMPRPSWGCQGALGLVQRAPPAVGAPLSVFVLHAGFLALKDSMPCTQPARRHMLSGQMRCPAVACGVMAPRQRAKRCVTADYAQRTPLDLLGPNGHSLALTCFKPAVTLRLRPSCWPTEGCCGRLLTGIASRGELHVQALIRRLARSQS